MRAIATGGLTPKLAPTGNLYFPGDSGETFIGTSMKKKLIIASSLGLLLGTAFAQTAPEAKPETPDKPVVLDPFVVQSSESEGYQANSTLAGTRLKTSLKDIASSITVVTRQFLDDTGVKDMKDLLVYTPGTEVAGIGGNFSGVGGLSGSAVTDAAFGNLNGTTRIRGLSSADLVRDYFTTSIAFDSYNTESVEINRGANSVLYGLGSPAGIINTNLKKPRFADGGEVTFAYGSYGTMRATIDAEKVLIPEKLSIRIAALNDERKYQQDPALSEHQALLWRGGIPADPADDNPRERREGPH